LNSRIFSKFFGGKIKKLIRVCHDKILAENYFKSNKIKFLEANTKAKKLEHKLGKNQIFLIVTLR